MAIEFINTTSVAIATSTSIWSIPTHSSREGGAAFIVGVGAQSSAITVDTVTDNAGNLYKLARRSTASPRGQASAELWYALNISSLSTRITVNWSANSTGVMAAGQWRGVSTQNALLEVASSVNSAASSVHRAGTEFTPSSNNALVIAFHRTQAATMVPVTIDGGMNTWLTTAVGNRTIGMYEIQTVASTVSGQWRTDAATSTGLTFHAGILAAFSDTQAAPAGGDNWYTNGLCLLGVQ